jgi:DNA-binding beta-propeller fold protein YncE
MGARGLFRRLGLAVATAAACLAVAAPVASAAPFVYVVNQDDDNLSQYEVGPGGRLTPLDPFTVATGPTPALVTVSPDGKSVYATNVGVLVGDPDDYNSAIYQYDLGADGTLSPKTPEMVLGCGAFRNHIALSPDGRYAYVTTWSDCGTVHQYGVDANGELSPLNPAFLDVGGFGEPTGVAVSPDGESVYIANTTRNGPLFQYDVGPDGTLSLKNPPSAATGNSPFGVAVNPDGRSVYVTNASDNNVSQYDVGPDGALSPKSRATVPVGIQPQYLVVSPNGKSAYVINAGDYPSPGSVSQYDIDPGSGALSPKTPRTVALDGNPRGIAVTPNSKSVYVTVATGNYGKNGSVSQFDVAAGGRLVAKSPATVDTGADPTGIAVSPITSKPAIKTQCRHGGWRQFGFRNQGQCIRFVNHRPNGGATPPG